MLSVSIIIPAYNQSKYLEFALESVLHQTFTNWECIIVNDGSTDYTEEIAKKYADHDKRFRYIKQENMGLSAARNTGLQLSQGKYIGFLDSDDTWEPITLEKTVDFLEKHPSVDIVNGAWDLIDEEGKNISRKFGPIKSTNYFDDLLFKNLFPVHTLLSRRTVFDQCGYFDARLRALEDWDMWMRAASHGFKFGHIMNLIAHYRRHSGAMTMDVDRLYDNTYYALDKLYCSQNEGDMIRLKPYVYSYQLLNLAILYNKKHEIEKMENTMLKAEMLFDDAVYIKKYSVLLDSVLGYLPGSTKFHKKIYVRSPLAGKLEIRSNQHMKEAIDCNVERNILGTFYHSLISCILWPPNTGRYVQAGIRKI